jgi:hypothetical protein
MSMPNLFRPRSWNTRSFLCLKPCSVLCRMLSVVVSLNWSCSWCLSHPHPLHQSIRIDCRSVFAVHGRTAKCRRMQRIRRVPLELLLVHADTSLKIRTSLARRHHWQKEQLHCGMLQYFAADVAAKLPWLLQQHRVTAFEHFALTCSDESPGVLIIRPGFAFERPVYQTLK